MKKTALISKICSNGYERLRRRLEGRDLIPYATYWAGFRAGYNCRKKEEVRR
jgi:hypothetical protein